MTTLLTGGAIAQTPTEKAPEALLFGQTRAEQQAGLARDAARWAQYVKEQRDRLDEAENQYRELQSRIESVQKNIRETSGRFDVSREALMKAAQGLDEQIETLQLEQQGTAARQERLEKAIADQTKRASTKVGDDAVAAELDKLVAIRVEGYQRAVQARQAGVMPEVEMSNAAAAVAEAKAKVAERRQLVATQAGGDALPAWNRELLNLGITEAEAQAKLRFLEDRRNRLAKCLPELDEVTRLEDALHDVRSQLSHERVELQNYERSKRDADRKAADANATKTQGQ